MLYEKLLRAGLFRLGGGDAEYAHDQTLGWLARATRRPALLRAMTRFYSVGAPTEAFGLRFPNPVGLAAGMDKNASALAAWPALGFGFVEVGTVTALAQSGNPTPRLYRLPSSEAVINRMGFNNHGAAALARRLADVGGVGVPVGVSLGKSKVTPLDEAVADYVTSLRLLYAHGDYFVVNVSSPNTPGLRTLQGREQLVELLTEVQRENRSLADSAGRAALRPMLVKLSPDLTDAAIAEAIEVCLASGVAGVVATNTTLERAGVAEADRALAGEAGGLSGRPVRERARAVVSFIHHETGGTLPIVGVGGILDADDALRMFDAGACLVQLCTGFIYRGPHLVKAINQAITKTASTREVRWRVSAHD